MQYTYSAIVAVHGTRKGVVFSYLRCRQEKRDNLYIDVQRDWGTDSQRDKHGDGEQENRHREDMGQRDTYI